MILIVSGVARTGTSMMMQCLVAGGIEAVYDKSKLPNKANPKGFFELENLGAWTITEDMWKDLDLDACEGKVVKIIAPWIWYLPIDPKRDFRIIYMTREYGSLVNSLERLDMFKHKVRWDDEIRQRMKEEMIIKDQTSLWVLRFQSNCRTVIVPYEEVIKDPWKYCVKIANNLVPGKKLNIEEMIKAVDPELWRNRPKGETYVKHSKADQLC